LVASSGAATSLIHLEVAQPVPKMTGHKMKLGELEMNPTTNQSGGAPDVPSIRLSRLTAGVYLLYFIAGLPLVLRASLIVPANAAATAAKITASEALYRTTMVTDLVSYMLYLGLAYLFYLLLRHVHRQWAFLGALFTVAGCIVLIAATSLLYAPLALLTGEYAHAIGLPERQELALLSIKVYNQAFIIGLLLFGVQWLIMGPLFAASRIIPRAVGYLLTAGGVAWVSFAIASLISPPIAAAIRPFVLAIGSLAEIALAVSLLVRRNADASLATSRSR
jgi:hypothetical protein